MTRRIRATLLLAALPTVALAQDALDMSPDQFSVMMNGPRFFAALVGGVLLAFAFQMLFTQLTMATGVSAVGDLHKLSPGDHRDYRNRPPSERAASELREHDRRAHGDTSGAHARTAEHVGTSDTSGTAGTARTAGTGSHHVADTVSDVGHSAGDMARKAIHGAGTWALITSSLALFFASWLAVELSLTLDLVVGAVIGLAIWAFFYLAVVLWEAAAVSSLAGSIARLASQGASSMFSGLGGLFSRSESRKQVDTAREVAHAVREELTRDLDVAGLQRKLDQYVHELQPPHIDPGQVKREVLDLLRNIQVDVEREPASETTSIGTQGDAHTGFGEEHLIARIESRGFSREDAQRMARGMRDAVQAARREWAEKDHTSAVMDTAAQVTGMSREDAEAFRGKVEAFLRGTGRSELDPDTIKQELEQLFTDPRGGMDTLRHRLSMFDRDTVLALLSQREGMDEERANHLLERIEEGLNTLRRQAERVQARGTETGQPSFRAPMVAHAERDRVWTETLDDYVERYERPQVEESAMKRELRMLLEDPQASAEDLLHRLRSLRQEDLRHLVTRIPWVDDADVDRVLLWFEETRDDIVHRVERLQREAQQRAIEAREAALDDAEEARKTTATAAWWAFTSAAVSGGAAAAGGLVAVLLTF